MEELGSGTQMDKNTGCAGPGSDTKKVFILYCILKGPRKSSTIPLSLIPAYMFV